MKKYIILFALGIITSLNSCSSDDENLNTSYSINPPDWIQGEWRIENSVFEDGSGFRFTNDDLIVILPMYETSLKTLYKQSVESGQNVTTEESKSDDSYTLKATFSTGITFIYGFTRISNTEISWDEVPQSVYKKQ